MAAKKKPFNKYTLTEAYQFLHVTRFAPWEIPFRPINRRHFFMKNWGGCGRLTFRSANAAKKC